QLDSTKAFGIFMGLYTAEFYQGQSLVPPTPLDLKSTTLCQKVVSLGKTLGIIRMWLYLYLAIVPPGARDDSNNDHMRKVILRLGRARFLVHHKAHATRKGEL
ncbi:MAG: hypothetical protein QGI09_07805, partial [Dehalococcoidia bacterium]|nr:hypothetical protein [Dehalococcoidia bacterium]